MILYWGGIIGLIIGFVVCDRNNAFVIHHLNQSIVLAIAAVISAILCAVLIGILGLICVFVFSIIGSLDAYKGSMNEIPVIGKIKIVK